MNLCEDPDELRNIVDHAPELACELEARLEAWIGDGMTRNGLEMDPLIAHGLTLGRAWKAERAGQTPA